MGALYFRRVLDAVPLGATVTRSALSVPRRRSPCRPLDRERLTGIWWWRSRPSPKRNNIVTRENDRVGLGGREEQKKRDARVVVRLKSFFFFFFFNFLYASRSAAPPIEILELKRCSVSPLSFLFRSFCFCFTSSFSEERNHFDAGRILNY